MRSFLIRAALVLLVIGAVLGFVGREGYQIIFNEPVDIYMDIPEDAEELKAGMAIDTEIYMLLDCFGSSEVEYKNRTGATYSTSSYDYYILPIFVGEEETYYVAFEVSDRNENRKAYQNIMEETYDYLVGESDTFGSYAVQTYGGLHKLDDELYDYMVEWFEEAEWFENDEDIEKYVLPLYFGKVSKTNMTIIFYVNIAALALGVLFLLLGIFAGGKNARRQKELKRLAKGKTINIAGVDYCLDKMDSVDKKIYKGNTEAAKKELMTSFKASELEAEKIVAEWMRITRGIL